MKSHSPSFPFFSCYDLCLLWIGLSMVFQLCSYDFAFVDADKKMYQDYFELLLQLVSSLTSRAAYLDVGNWTKKIDCILFHFTGESRRCYSDGQCPLARKGCWSTGQLCPNFSKSHTLHWLEKVIWTQCFLNEQVDDSRTVSIRNFNRNLVEDDRVCISMVRF